jgi:hypothetical protein
LTLHPSKENNSNKTQATTYITSAAAATPIRLHGDPISKKEQWRKLVSVKKTLGNFILFFLREKGQKLCPIH